MKSITWFILISALLTTCTAVTTPNPTLTPISTYTAIFVVRTSTPSIVPTLTSSPDPTDTQTPMPSTTFTPTAEPTPTPEPTQDPNDEAIKQILSEEIGPDWSSFIYRLENHFQYQIKMISDGEYLDYTDNPVIIPISENPEENPEMLVGRKAYYLDLVGDKQELILPLVLRLTDGRIYRLGPYMNNIVDWPLEEVISNLHVEEQNRGYDHVGGLNGEILEAFFIPVENITDFYRSFGFNPPGDPYNIIDGINEMYQEFYKEELEDFIASGKPPSSGIYFPSSQSGFRYDVMEPLP